MNKRTGCAVGEVSLMSIQILLSLIQDKAIRFPGFVDDIYKLYTKGCTLDGAYLPCIYSQAMMSASYFLPVCFLILSQVNV